MPRRILFVLISLTLLTLSPAAADEPAAGIDDRLARLEAAVASAEHRFGEFAKQMDDLLWFERVGDVAVVDKVRIYGPPAANEPNPTGIGAGNHVKFYAYLFTPRSDFSSQKLPLLVLPHGGVHADFTTYHTHIVRELIAQGYIVAAPDYRGSTGYGEGFWKRIDYGGREVEDALAARDWVVANHPRVDPDRVGLVGWSHGGLITLMSLFDHPEAYACGFAGVPVSDLVMRLGYSDPSYRALFEADHHIGQSVNENLEEYKRRSPAWQVDRLTRPLRIHTNPRDEDVNFIEVERLVQALQAAGKDFEYQVYDVPGGHSHDRLDTPEAWQARRDIYEFLARYLKPPNPKIELGISEAGLASP
jgi:dipeptidyl aminopeptidase/acylaminoacyl peptidase